MQLEQRHQEVIMALHKSDMSIKELVHLLFVMDAENGENDSTRTFDKIVKAATDDIIEWVQEQVNNQ